VLFCIAAPARAQQVTGMAEWVVSRGSMTSDDDKQPNNIFSQSYSLGYRSVLWDPRFLQYNGEVTFRTNAMTFGSQDGRAKDLGFKFGVNLFPERPFPLSVQFLRNGISESGDLQSASAIRGGLPVPPGEPLPDFFTRNSALQVNWALATSRLPRIDVSYRRDNSTVTGGGYEGAQRGSQMNASAFKETPRTRQVLRFQRHTFDSAVSQTFNQELSDLAYELNVNTGARHRVEVRAGRRHSLSLFDLPPAVTDIGVPTYAPSSNAGSTVYYAQSSLNWEPTSRLSADPTVSADRDTASVVSTAAYLVSSGAQWEIGRGFSVTGRGTYGVREQDVAGEQITVISSNAGGGFNFSRTVKFIQAGAGYGLFGGSNQGAQNQTGSTNGWNWHANAGTVFQRIPNVTASYDRGASTDEVLEFGNQAFERRQIAVHGALSSRMSVQATWEETFTERGRELLLQKARHSILSGTLTIRPVRTMSVAVTVGQFENRTTLSGADHTKFASVGAEARISRALGLSFNLRRESIALGLVRQQQDATYSLGRLEYQLRLFTLAIEHRYTDAGYRMASEPAHQMLGNQVLFRVSRRFAF